MAASLPPPLTCTRLTFARSGAGAPFDLDAVRAGQQTPMFFGSARATKATVAAQGAALTAREAQVAALVDVHLAHLRRSLDLAGELFVTVQEWAVTPSFDERPKSALFRFDLRK